MVLREPQLVHIEEAERALPERVDRALTHKGLARGEEMREAKSDSAGKLPSMSDREPKSSSTSAESQREFPSEA